ncbi:MAG TPA: glycoside hydrolase domain-containing protein [Planctomycetota bacterium]|nr:glycoside hydrolase domain-containing protein [Planctomycetota bacterium]HUW56541.1 glycoside hydrolase domain-containing protein [Planctomycetota bacterium]
MMLRRVRRLAAASLAALLLFPPGLSAQEKKPETLILDTSGFWRYHYVLRTPVVSKGGTTEELEFKCETPLAPVDWMKPGFDDRSWHRARRAPLPAIAGAWTELWKWDVGAVCLNHSSPCLALICMRGRFEVTDAAEVKDLVLSVAYRGGVAVYLNGREIVRGHLPQAGPLTVETLAETYPDETYLYPDGTLLDTDDKKSKAVKDRYTARTRRLADVTIPVSVLRKGTNVLAVEVHRAPYPGFLVEKLKGQKSHRLPVLLWDTCGIVDVRLTSENAGGIVANVTRPKGLQLWNGDPLAADFDLDFGDPNESLRPISIVGTRGGVFSGKVVVGSDEAIEGLRATPGALVRKGGGGVIAASACRVRYACPQGQEAGADGHYPAAVERFDALDETPPDEVAVRVKKKTQYNRVTPGQPQPVFGAVVPVWLTVSVPRHVPAGDYEGTLTVTADDIKPVPVPVSLKVHAWRMPPAHDFHTFVDLVQSPDSLALYYDVPFWSERHFQLIEESFRHLAEVGNKTVHLPLICHMNTGNEQTMVRWIKLPGGRYAHDFSVMDRYLSLYEKHCGRPEAVCLGVWDVFLEGGAPIWEGRLWSPMREDYERVKGQGPLVTLLDPATGTLPDLQLPPYTKDEGSKTLWKPVFDQLRLRMKARGWEDRVVLGYVHDTTPTQEVVEFFKELLPGCRWLRQAHGSRGKDLHGVPYALEMVVWSPRYLVYPDVKSGLGWRSGTVQFPRELRDWFPLTTFRLLGEMNIMGQQRGFGKLGADFWPVLKDQRGRRVGTVSGRYPKSRWLKLSVETALLAPGKDGALSTARLDMMREGLQECEARISIEEALMDDASRAKLGDPLVRRCRQALDERTLAIEQGLNSHAHCGFRKTEQYEWWSAPGQVGWRWYLASGWQARSDRLYALAAEVAAKLGEE